MIDPQDREYWVRLAEEFEALRKEHSGRLMIGDKLLDQDLWVYHHKEGENFVTVCGQHRENCHIRPVEGCLLDFRVRYTSLVAWVHDLCDGYWLMPDPEDPNQYLLYTEDELYGKGTTMPGTYLSALQKKLRPQV